MPNETDVRVSVRVTPANRRRLVRERKRLLSAVAAGTLAPDRADERMGRLNQELTEYRIGDGPWRPLASYAGPAGGSMADASLLPGA